MSNKIKSLFNDKKGLTLVETLVALTILTLVLFCITPLFLSNLETIRTSGDKAKVVYKNAGVMQKILANFETGDENANSGYYVNVASASITLSGNELDPANACEYTVNDAQGALLVSNPNDISTGYSTVMADAPDSSFQVFPKTLTDDFKEAYLTVAAVGFTFTQNPEDDKSAKFYKLSCSVNGTDTPLKYGQDYTLRRVQSKDPTAKNRIIQIVLYGGTQVNFSNSPLTFEYNRRKVEIQIDAPSMIMVGEKAADGYHYYVSRGEMEKDEKGNDRLIVLERNMPDNLNTPDDEALNSAMNDVAWVSAEDADNEAVGKNGEKYGYYVMCGDNGQIRRFWQNKTTGNYYWGGDYTYYTDINLNRVEGKEENKIESYVKPIGPNDDGKGRTLSTSVSYKFLARRGTRGNEGDDGYKLVQGTTTAWTNDARNDNARAVTANMWTVTALDGSDASKYAYFYGTDGKMFYYYLKDYIKNKDYKSALNADDVGNGTFEDLHTNLFKKSSYDGYAIQDTGYYDEWDFEALSWLRPNQDSYYDLYGIDKPTEEAAASYPITLTSVGAIVLQGCEENNIGDKKAYAKSTSYKNYDVSDGKAVIDKNFAEYPTETYTLYCGYIPSAYDVWSRKAHKGAKADFAGEGDKANLIVAAETYNEHYDTNPVGSKLDRRDKSIINSAAEKNMLWRGTFGVTPYLTEGDSVVTEKIAQLVYTGYKSKGLGIFSDKTYRHDYLYYWPYDNLNYAVSGKFFDISTPEEEYKDLFKHKTSASLMVNRIYTTRGVDNSNANDKRQQYLTGGKVIDITCSYFSHPFALHVAANPSIDSKAYMLSNNKTKTDEWSYYYANRRETVTILKIASTRIPVPIEAGASEEEKKESKDIAVSLAVGYAQGGSITLDQSGGNYPAFVNNIMPIGIVYLRAGTADIDTQMANGNRTNEYQAIDETGYKLQEESNYFHQFYYLNSKLDENTQNAAGQGRHAGGDEYTLGGVIKNQAHIGDMYGAYYWENNRHIVHRSADGGEPLGNTHSKNKDGNGSYNYVRCHPMLDTKVTCVAWGTTWDNNPEAMWGTDNGTVLSWDVNLNKVQEEDSSKWNDKSVQAEFQSYQWIENVDDNYFSVTGNALFGASTYKDTVGAHLTNGDGSGNNYTAQKFTHYNTGPINEAFSYFCDKSTQENGYWKDGYGFISILSSINDIAYANDYWVAVGVQSGKDPAEYCGNDTLPNELGLLYGGENKVQAYTGNGRGGSWINVRYWYDKDKDNPGKQSDDNATYLWKAVKISKNSNYNIVQINPLNGIWYATGYEDWNKNGEWDLHEKAVVCWARDPLAACDSGAEGRWSENTAFYEYNGNGGFTALPASQVGGINSVACRDDM